MARRQGQQIPTAGCLVPAVHAVPSGCSVLATGAVGQAGSLDTAATLMRVPRDFNTLAGEQAKLSSGEKHPGSSTLGDW